MNMHATYVTLFCIGFGALFYQTDGASVGDACQVARNGAQGECKLLNDCEEAVKAYLAGMPPNQCGFIGREQIVCCPVKVTTTTTTTPVPTRISQYSEWNFYRNETSVV